MFNNSPVDLAASLPGEPELQVANIWNWILSISIKHWSPFCWFWFQIIAIAPQVMIEPGRSLVATAGLLLTRVIGRWLAFWQSDGWVIVDVMQLKDGMQLEDGKKMGTKCAFKCPWQPKALRLHVNEFFCVQEKKRGKRVRCCQCVHDRFNLPHLL